jgi:hypothetical protein
LIYNNHWRVFFSKKTKYEVFHANGIDCDVREKEFKVIFNNKFRLARGWEYFDGNVIDMVYEFCNFCNQYDILEKTLINSSIMKNNEIIKICNSQVIEDHVFKINMNKIENDIKNIININFSINKKVELIQKYNLNEKVTDDKIKDILMIDFDIDIKVSYLYSFFELKSNIGNNKIIYTPDTNKKFINVKKNHINIIIIKYCIQLLWYRYQNKNWFLFWFLFW